MGNKLSRQEQGKSDDAIYYFNQQCEAHNIFKAKVRVIENGEILLEEKNVPISIFERYDWWEVHIVWESVGLGREEYRAQGLYGYYSTGYCKMQCVGSCLIINSDNGIQIEITE